MELFHSLHTGAHVLLVICPRITEGGKFIDTYDENWYTNYCEDIYDKSDNLSPFELFSGEKLLLFISQSWNNTLYCSTR